MACLSVPDNRHHEPDARPRQASTLHRHATTSRHSRLHVPRIHKRREPVRAMLSCHRSPPLGAIQSRRRGTTPHIPQRDIPRGPVAMVKLGGVHVGGGIATATVAAREQRLLACAGVWGRQVKP